MKKVNVIFIMLSALLLVHSCSKKKRPEIIPTGPVNLTIDLNLPANLHLNNVGTFSYFTGGVKGVMVVHDFDDQWYAFERTCAWQPLNACSIIWGDSTELNIKCGTYNGNVFSTCCESKFSFNGFPSKGPANGRLATYQISKSGNLLYVYN